MDQPTAPRNLTICRVSVDSLHLDPANARQHAERNLESIRSSLQRFGQAGPLVVHRGSGRVIGGNGRMVAMRKLGWSECDVVDLDLLETKAAALGIALNRTAELAAWDEKALARPLEGLRADDSLAGIGFDDQEVGRLIRDLNRGGVSGELVDPGPEDPPEDPVSAVGDLWVLDDHRLLCGDSTRTDDNYERRVQHP